MQFLYRRGFDTVANLYRYRHGCDLPPTYGTSTTNDVALLSHDLVPLIDHIYVDTPGPFAGHHPLCFSLKLGQQQLYRYGWQLPQPWLCFEPDPAQISQHFESRHNDTSRSPSEHATCPLQQWALDVEYAVDKALTHQHQVCRDRHPVAQLPRAYKGRCRPRKLVYRPLPKSIKQACQGQWTPDTDLRSIGLGQRTRQLRRLQSLRFLALKHRDPLPDTILVQMHLEWKAIQHSTGFHGGFRTWCEAWPALVPVPQVFPTTTWLSSAIDQLTLVLQQEIKHAHSKQRKHAKYIQEQDLKRFGKQEAYAYVRGETAGLIQNVPMQYEHWVQSIFRLKRHWVLHGNLVPHGHARVGVPEGDSWSVLCMLAVNYFMSVHVERPAVRLQAYADNWTYGTTDPTLHDGVLQSLCQITDSLYLTVDWTKCWAWSTCSAHADILLSHASQVLQQDLPLQMVCNARELGYTLHYRPKQSRTTQNTRHDVSLQRLQRLQKLEVDFDTKAEVARASCITKALYGTSMYLPGEKYFAQLRTAIARALLGNHHNVQPYVANMCLSSKLIDPELYAIQMALLHAREYLMFATPEQKRRFLQVVATFSRMPGQVTGPAGALRWYLSKVTWFCNRTGHLETPFEVPLHIFDSNVEDLVCFLHMSWMIIVSDNVNTRHGMRGAPVIDRARTWQAFHDVEADMQVTVGLDMTGGFMVNSQKMKFADLPDDTCVYCPAPDSHRHRVLECPVTEHIRALYPEVTTFLSDHDDMHTILPLHYEHPDTAAMLAMLYCLPEPHIASCIQSPLVFTDGSCLHPNSVDHRIAAYSIVTATVSDQQLFSHRGAPVDWLVQNCYTVHAVALVTGRQTINRAELTAAVLAFEHGISVLVTDSQFVMQQIDLIQHTLDWRVLHKHKHFDLLKRLHIQHWEHGHPLRVEKILAHQSPDIPDFELAIRRMGNAAADYVASTGVKRLATPLTSQIHRMKQEADATTELLKKQYQMRGLFGKHRAHLDKPEQQQWEYRDPDNQATLFQEWTLTDPQTFPLPDDFETICSASRCGADYTHLILQWLTGLQWPQQPDLSTPPTGITWVELALNFWLTTGVPPKVNTAPSGQLAQYVQLATSDAYLMDDFTFLHMSIAFQNCVKHICFLAGTTLLPSLEPVRVKSLYLVGWAAFEGTPEVTQLIRSLAVGQVLLVVVVAGGGWGGPVGWCWWVVAVVVPRGASLDLLKLVLVGGLHRAFREVQDVKIMTKSKFHNGAWVKSGRTLICSYSKCSVDLGSSQAR
eukprot:Skav216000  [mRNA]  locus=scaffold833:30904:36484:- [translate_table: standard]